MKLFDTLTQEQKLLDKKNINIYSCGPTVYDFIHVGNARPIILMDTLIRFLEANNVKVNFLQNITDIDDKIIERAIAENITEEEIADKYTKAFKDNLKKLNIRMPDKLIPISDKIKQMETFILELLNTSDAYESNRNIYFNIKENADQYGKLSKAKIEDLISGARVQADENKQDPLDFALWKNTEKGKKWNIGNSGNLGRPGWHTECAVLIDEYFNKETVDIHSGGIDLQFPHHENERIQYIAKNKKEIADIWMHNGHLTIDREKMSKSLGNAMTLTNFLEKYNPDILRWIFLITYYKQPINISDDLIEQGNKFIVKLNNLNKKVKQLVITDNFKLDDSIDKEIIDEFNNFMNDDLNTSRVLTLIEDVLKDINKVLLSKDFLVITKKINALNFVLNTLGLSIKIDANVNVNDKQTFLMWKELISAKDFEQADKIRESLVEKGIL
ncbi:cysteine--tRNA ligase [Mesoplasma melaleucae]|uniref:Cysteine--tRNA ligase n=1 Tax=Mesoplasma melaleucae TaxID=81459 RepID=A0A2K8NVW5_9MOLU|nr:cysteine--tRNA ligase [Mesoplasma melaleucae]ATZ17696.1 cysteinyl-tRNA synthetase [Mesoplasma melaleucae]